MYEILTSAVSVSGANGGGGCKCCYILWCVYIHMYLVYIHMYLVVYIYKTAIIDKQDDNKTPIVVG